MSWHIWHLRQKILMECELPIFTCYFWCCASGRHTIPLHCSSNTRTSVCSVSLRNINNVILSNITTSCCDVFRKNATFILDIILTEDPWILKKRTYRKEEVLQVPQLYMLDNPWTHGQPLIGSRRKKIHHAVILCSFSLNEQVQESNSVNMSLLLYETVKQN